MYVPDKIDRSPTEKLKERISVVENELDVTKAELLLTSGKLATTTAELAGAIEKMNQTDKKVERLQLMLELLDLKTSGTTPLKPSDVSFADLPVVPSPPVDHFDKGWTCRLCHQQNSDTHTKCRDCMSPRNKEVKKKAVHNSAPVRTPTPVISDVTMSARHLRWACFLCKHHENYGSHCKCCDSPKH